MISLGFHSDDDSMSMIHHVSMVVHASHPRFPRGMSLISIRWYGEVCGYK